MAYFLTDDNSTKGRDPNINIINGIHKIKGKNLSTSYFPIIPISMSLLNKGKYIGHLEPAIMDDTTIDNLKSHSANTTTLQKMMAEQVQPDIFDPSHHKLKPGIQSRLDTLLKEYETQFEKGKTSTSTTPLTEMTIDSGNSEPVSQNHTLYQ